MLIAELNNERRIGAEFEMTFPLVGAGNGDDIQKTLAAVLSSNGLPAVARSYSISPVPIGRVLAIEYDSSVQGESRFSGITWHSIEMKTKILSGINDWERIVPKALEICRYMGARVNRSTGHHVHVDFPEAKNNPKTIRSLYNLVHKYENVIYGLVCPSRRENGYARRMPHRPKLLHGCRASSSFRRALSGWDRRCGLNLTHLWCDEPRIEYRYHGGTLDSTKARHWARLLNRIVEHSVTRNCQASSEQMPNTREAFESFRYTIGLRSNAGIYSKVSPELRETSRYLLQRWKQFHTETDG